MELQENLAIAKTREEQIRIHGEIEEIKNRQKPLHECNIEECMELKTAVYEKFDQLQKIGKTSYAINFKRMIIEIEKRMNTVYRQMSNDAIEKKKLSNEKETKSDNVEKRKPVKKSGASRWTTGVGNLD